MHHNCPYCGYEFEDTHKYCNTACPLSKKCGMIMCPNCRYEYVPADSKTVNFFKKLFKSNKASQTAQPEVSENQHA